MNTFLSSAILLVDQKPGDVLNTPDSSEYFSGIFIVYSNNFYLDDADLVFQIYISTKSGINYRTKFWSTGTWTRWCNIPIDNFLS